MHINQHQAQIRVVKEIKLKKTVTWDAESLILSPGRTPGFACSCCVEKSDDDEPANEMGAAATAPWWRSDDLLRMSLASILSILDALWPG